MTLVRIPAAAPDDWRALLADPTRHWRVGYSAYELAHAWHARGGLPESLAAAFAGSELGGVELLLALPEHKVRMPGKGGHSATDLFALARRQEGDLVAIAVEGKVDEGFDWVVEVWLQDASGDADNRAARLEGLAQLLGLDVSVLSDIRYQLLHRTAAALVEAKRFNARYAVMAVQSFSSDDAGLDDFRRFAALFGGTGEPGRLERVAERDGTQLHLCWLAEKAAPQAHGGEPEAVLREALDWLRDTYPQHRFFKERDVEAALQARMIDLFEERRSGLRVYENHRVDGKQLDLAVVDRHTPSNVLLGIELKYEPDHGRAGKDMRGDTERLPVCIRSEIERDVAALQRCVEDGAVDVGYALLVDEGGYWRTRSQPPGGTCEIWGKDRERRLAPALFLTRVPARS